MDENRELKKGFVADLIWGKRLPEIMSGMITFRISLTFWRRNFLLNFSTAYI
jgi:hypothetical protein